MGGGGEGVGAWARGVVVGVCGWVAGGWVGGWVGGGRTALLILERFIGVDGGVELSTLS